MPESYVSAINFLSFWTVIWFLKRLIEFPAAPVDWVTSSLDKTSATCFLLWGHGCLSPYCLPYCLEMTDPVCWLPRMAERRHRI